jgi:hypothetical protein
MSWEALTALASLVNATIVVVAAFAAVLQLRHLRLANQLQSYLQFTQAMQAPEFIEARRFLQTHDFADPETLAAATTPELDRRLSTIGVHYQSVARLMNRGVLDEELFAHYFDMMPRVWRDLQPVAAVIRERLGVPTWIDIEYLVYRAEKRNLLHKYLNRYPDDFVRQAKLGKLIAAAKCDVAGNHGDHVSVAESVKPRVE